MTEIMIVRKRKNGFFQHKIIACAGILLIVLGIAQCGIAGKATSGSSFSGALSSATATESSVDTTTTTTSTTTETSTPTSTTPVVAASPKVYKGKGDDVVSIQKPSDDEPAIVLFECPRCQGNTVVKTNGADSLLVNSIGKYSGSHLIDIRVGSVTSQVTINATGSWTLTVSGLDKAMRVAGQAVQGSGDSVLYVSGTTSTAAISNTGTENFIVNVYPARGGYSDLAVNTIGGYKGVVPLEAPSIVQIISSGSWFLAPS
jgi:hypothetical protein